MNLILIQSVAIWFMTGVTWTLQLLSYPLVGKIKPDDFSAYQTAHNQRFGRLMIPGVLIAVLTTFLLFFIRPKEILWWVPAGQAILLLVITGSAAIYTAPAHQKLEKGFDPALFRTLIITNRFRLTLWMMLSAWSLYLLRF